MAYPTRTRRFAGTTAVSARHQCSGTLVCTGAVAAPTAAHRGPLKLARRAAKRLAKHVREVALVDTANLDRHRANAHLGVDQQLHGPTHPTLPDVLVRCEAGRSAKLPREVMRTDVHDGGEVGHSDRSVQVAGDMGGNRTNLVPRQGIRAIPARPRDRSSRRSEHTRQALDQFLDVVGPPDGPALVSQEPRHDGRSQEALERIRVFVRQRRFIDGTHGSGMRSQSPAILRVLITARTGRGLRSPVLPNTLSQKEHDTP